MRRKIIEDFWLKYQNDLFEIKLIFLRSKLNVAFLLIDATDRSKISSNRKRLFFALRLYPLSFFASTPFNIKQLYQNSL